MMPAPTSCRAVRPRLGRVACCALAAGAALLASGCVADLDTQYGRSTPRVFSTSINGVDVFAQTFASAGHHVSGRSVIITSAMDRVQTIVWFPDDFAAPDEELCDWFDEWLASGSNRTLIYVGRGFDAAPLYWKQMTPLVDGGQVPLYQERRIQSRGQTSSVSAFPTAHLMCQWFEIKPGTLHEVTRLGGPWSREIDPARYDFWMSDALAPLVDARVLLTADGMPMVWRHRPVEWNGGQLITVANGSFLLNLPLVNHEHRRLAGRLIDEVDPSGDVVFLSSGPGGPAIDLPGGGSALAKLFGTWPLGPILLQLAVVGVIFCFARWPIFGRARVPQNTTTSDFGHHVDAVSQLLQRTRDRDYARSQLPEEVEAATSDASRAPPRRSTGAPR